MTQEQEKWEKEFEKQLLVWENGKEESIIPFFKDFLRHAIQTAREEGEKEVVICAAVRASDGLIIRGHRHANALRAMQEMRGYEKERPYGDAQGFITSKNRYVNRTEGLQIQLSAGIESFDKGGYRGGELYSEDLY